jgi:hypothetical protein
MIKFNNKFKDGKGFNLLNVEVYKKGDLKGYVSGMLETEYSDQQHEFLYRFNDSSNGENFKLVTVDYGYMIPLKENHFDYIERVIFNDYLRNKDLNLK